MLKLYNKDRIKAFPLDVEYSITHTMTGYDQLEFEIPAKSDFIAGVVYEAVVQERDNLYLIKSIEADRTTVNVGCALMLDDFKTTLYQSYRRTDISMEEALLEMMPTGWTFQGDLPTNRTTVEQSEGQPLELVTPYDILPHIAEAFDRCYHFDILRHVVSVIDVATVPALGGYLTDELNLEAVVRSGSSASFATRLHCYGKKDENGSPITFESINDGKDYIEDRTYCNKLIEAAWSDERYTDPQSLFNAAQLKLAELAHPVESYNCTVLDLQKAKPQYGFLEIAIHRRLWLIDRHMHTCIEHRVVEYKEFRGRENSYTKNQVTLSTLSRKLETKVQQAMTTANSANIKAESAIQSVNDMYTPSEVDHLISVERTTAHAELTEAIQAEQQRADAMYLEPPICGKVTLTNSALSKVVSVPYSDFFVTLTPTASGNCWAVVSPNTVTVTADTAMTVYYSIMKGSESDGL